MALRSAALTLLLAGCAGAGPSGFDSGGDTVLARYDWQRPAARCALPPVLDEISGLVDDGAGGLLGLHDNGSDVFRVSCDGVTPLATPATHDGDFEGLARRGASLYLLTSPGVVFTASWSVDGQSVGAITEAPGFGRVAAGQCGFEGIEVVSGGALLLACKYPRAPTAGTIRLVEVPLSGGGAKPWIVPVAPVLQALHLSRLRPSGLAWLPGDQRLLVLVGKERVILELDRSGTLLAWRRLARAFHRQAEGIAMLPDGRIVVADEADGRRPTLTTYAASDRAP